jgi:hypothetical protein
MTGAKGTDLPGPASKRGCGSLTAAGAPRPAPSTRPRQAAFDLGAAL